MIKQVILYLILSTILNFSQTREERIDSIIFNFLEYEELGGTLLISKEDEVIYLKSFGYADIENKIINNENTIYKIGSISKQMTAAAIFILKEKGLLNIDDSITKYFPELNENYKDITIENLLIHNSGIKSFTSLPEWNLGWENKQSAKDVYDFVKDLHFDFESGEKFKYNNSGYVILALLIEKISGKNFSEFMKDEIFLPLGMKNTLHGTDDADIGFRSIGYRVTKDNNLIEKDFNIELEQFSGTGSIISNVYDLLKWKNAIGKNNIISIDAWNEIYSPKIKTNFGDSIYYGYGTILNFNTEPNIKGHNGMIAGFYCAFYFVPESEHTFIWLSNNSYVHPDKLIYKLLEIIKY